MLFDRPDPKASAESAESGKERSRYLRHQNRRLNLRAVPAPDWIIIGVLGCVFPRASNHPAVFAFLLPCIFIGNPRSRKDRKNFPPHDVAPVSAETQACRFCFPPLRPP